MVESGTKDIHQKVKIEGYVICQPVNTWGDKTKSKWDPKTWTFGRTAHEAWIRWIDLRPSDDEWDRVQQEWINHGYCPKKTTMEVEFD